MRSQKGFSLVIIITIVAILIAVGVFIAVKKGTLRVYNKESGQQITQTQQPQISAIQNNSDLGAASTDLDNTDIDGMDAELNQINSDASNF